MNFNHHKNVKRAVRGSSGAGPRVRPSADPPERTGESLPMRIGFLTLDWPPMSGGMARFCHETAAALARRGHDIVVLAGRNAADVPGVTVIRGLIGDLSHDVHLVRAHAEKIDIWHGWEHGFGGLADSVAAPMVVTVHGNDLFSPKVYYRFTHTPMLHRLAPRMSTPTWQRRMCRASFERVAAFLPNSANTARLLTGHYPECCRALVVPCGVSDSFFQARSTRTPGPPRLLTVCTLSSVRPRKNVTGILQALALLKEAHAFGYDVVGDGDRLEDHRSLAASLGLADRVRFHGPVADEGLKALYRAADLFVLAPRGSDTDVEGFGIVYLEANASGVPVLAVRTGGVTDAVCDGVSGYFAASPEPGDLAPAIAKFLTGDVRFDDAAVRGWAKAHRYETIATRVEAVYARALGLTRNPAWPPKVAVTLSESSVYDRASASAYTSHVGTSHQAMCRMPSV